MPPMLVDTVRKIFRTRFGNFVLCGGGCPVETTEVKVKDLA